MKNKTVICRAIVFMFATSVLVLTAGAAGPGVGSEVAPEPTVREVSGEAGYLTDKGVLKVLTKGMRVPADTTIVTGLSARLVVALNNAVVTLEPLTVARLRGVSMTSTETVAEVALQSGSVLSEVSPASGVSTRLTVTTPAGISEVTGTVHRVSYGPGLGMDVQVVSGTVMVSSPRGGSRPVVAGQRYTQSASGITPPRVQAEATVVAGTGSAGMVFWQSGADEGPYGSGFSSGTDEAGVIVPEPVVGSVSLQLEFPD